MNGQEDNYHILYVFTFSKEMKYCEDTGRQKRVGREREEGGLRGKGERKACEL